MIIRSSQVLNRTPTPVDTRVREAVPWPKGDGRWALVPPAAIPPGMQSLQAIVPMRLATCEEVDCPRYLQGSTEVMTGSGPQFFVGHLSAEEVVGTGKVGYQGSSLPVVIHHPPGKPVCDVVHKLPSGAPPLYIVDGKPVVQTEFVDRLGGGVETVIQRRRAG